MVKSDVNSNRDAHEPPWSRSIDRRQLLRVATLTGLGATSLLASILSACSESGDGDDDEGDVTEAPINPFSEVTPEPQPSVAPSQGNVDDDTASDPSDPSEEDTITVETARRPDDPFIWYAINAEWVVYDSAAQMLTQHEEGRLLLDTGINDHTIEATINLPASAGEHYAGLYVRYVDGKNFVHARYLEQSGNSEIEVFQRWNGEIRLIIFVNFHQSVNGTTRKMRLATRGSQVAVYDGDELVGQGVTDISGTVVGLGAFGDQPPEGTVPWTDIVVSSSNAPDDLNEHNNFHLHEQFQEDDVPPIELPRPADPGPGEWTIDQSDEKLEFRHEMLSIRRAADWNDPQIWTSSPLPRPEVGALEAIVRVEGATHGAGVFLSSTQAPQEPHMNARGLYATTTEFVVANSGLLIRPAGHKPDVSNRSVDHLVCVIPRSGGGTFLLVSGGRYSAFPEASLQWVEASGLGEDVYAGLAAAPNTNVSVDDVRVIKSTDLPEGFADRFGISITADDFSFDGEDGANGLHGRPARVGEATWEVVSSGELLTLAEARLQYAGSFEAVVESRAGARTLDATFNVEGNGSSFGLIVRAEAPGSGSVYFGYLHPQRAWAIWGDDGELFWSTHADESQLQEGTDIRLCVMDNGLHMQLFANDISLTGAAWHEVNQGQGASWAGIFSEGSDSGSVSEFAIWPHKVLLNGAFDALKDPPEASEVLAVDDFDVPNGTDLDYRAIETTAFSTWGRRGVHSG